MTSNFVHLHVHSQYSILDGASSIKGLIEKAQALGMPAIALTDHGNMFGVKEFIDAATEANEPIHKAIKELEQQMDEVEANNGNQSAMDELKKSIEKEKTKLIKPIVGCEAYITPDRHSRHKDYRGGNHLVLLAKDLDGYHNLVKMVSYSWTEGFYQRPRIDKDLLRKYGKGIIVSSACLGGEIPQAILNNNIPLAQEIIAEYKEMFGDDFYLEVMLHPVEPGGYSEDTYQSQAMVNKVILELAEKTNTKCIATNDVHFINAEDALAHDRLICLNTGKDLDDPNRLRYTMQEYLKSEAEMARLFPNNPEVLTNTLEIANKVEFYSLNHDPIMPHFELPEGFTDDNVYLQHITYEGAKQRWGQELSPEIEERLNFELEVIARMGYPGYFLIVWDLIKAAREMDVSVGPGRGSAAGSAVAYSLRITDIDPIKYNLLFERFLNPDRISMPDIDIDFDEDGRDLVLQWVVDKYGKEKVAQIITFGTMAARMAIRDVARVQKLPLNDADRIAKMVPDRPGITLAKAFKETPELVKCKNSPDELIRSTLQYAEVLEGSVRHTGLHACGIIIGADNLEEYIPISTSKDTELYVTQYDGSHVESVGLLKMDFLGLKTLSIIKDAVEIIEESKGITVDIDTIPLDDEKTFELYARGDTTALFQFESPGMKKHLRALKPNRFEDLIAMNALYRPGPMAYIPSFINRKHGREKIDFDIPEMEEYLSDTYGITVYQEQVMILSQRLAGFTRGQADTLRKAMGKKLKSEMDSLKKQFVDGCQKNGFEIKKVEKIWSDWEAFAQYAFNKSHSTCYAYLSYQTAYLKAHYPSEFMAAVLSRNLSDIKKITLFMDECRRMGIQVLGPDLNESNYKFTVLPNGDIRFGLGAIKGVGKSAVISIIETRKEGKFKNLYDFFERISFQSVNKKNLEAFALAGAFDNFEIKERAQFFAEDSKEVSFLEQLIRYGTKIQQETNNAQQTLFGATDSGFEIQKPEIPQVEGWSKLETLNKEKDVVGVYLSAHPLDDYKLEFETFCNAGLSDLKDPSVLQGRELTVGGIVTDAKVLTTKTGNYYGRLHLEDFSDSYEFVLFGKDFENYRKFFFKGYNLLIRGKFEQDRFRPDEVRFNIRTIQMLSDVRDELIKQITIALPIEDINSETITEIQNMAKDHSGKVILKFQIRDDENKVGIEMFSRSYKINPTNEFIEHLMRMNLHFKIN